MSHNSLTEREVIEAGQVGGGGLPGCAEVDGELDRKRSGASDEDLESDAEPCAVTGSEGGRILAHPDRAAWCPLLRDRPKNS